MRTNLSAFASNVLDFIFVSKDSYCHFRDGEFPNIKEARMRRFLIIVSLFFVFSGFTLATTSARQNTSYVVQPGDNLFRISLRFNTTVAALAAANGITNVNLIFAGQTLIIPGPGGNVPPPVTTPPAGGTPAPGTTTYVVAPGDTLSKIAQRFGTTYLAIAAANGIANPNLIYVGQVLNIPGASGVPPTPPPGGGPVSGGFELGGQVFSFSYPTQMQGAGMTWAKSQIRWNQGDPASIVQGAIDAAHSKGFKILLSINGNPAQIAANPTQYYQNFANFLASVAQLNPDGIEVWNEANIDREWPTGQVSGQAYTQMLSAAYQAIKNANANVLVISGAPSPTGFFGGCAAQGCDDLPFIQQMASAGAGQFADCIGVHYNEGILSPDATSGDPRGNGGYYTRYYWGMVNTYASVFPSKSLCFTELGYLSPQGYGPLPPGFEWAANVTQQNQAEWLARAVTLSRSNGRIRLLMVWNVDSTAYNADPQAGYAIIRPDNTCTACITMGAAMGVQ
jgi:LysM repeat protein